MCFIIFIIIEVEIKMGNFKDYWLMIVYFAVIALFIAGLLFARKYLLKRMGGAKSGKYIKIIDRLIVAQDKQMIMLDVGNKILIVGVSPQKIDAIAEFSKEEFGDISAEDQEVSNSGTFGGNFLSLLGKKLNNKDSGKK